MAKMTREEMIEFIEANKAQYAVKADVEKVSEMADYELQKCYRALKTKMWAKSRKKPANMAERIEAAQTYDECEAIRAELVGFMTRVDERMVELKADKIESLKTLINDSKAQLKELQG